VKAWSLTVVLFVLLLANGCHGPSSAEDAAGDAQTPVNIKAVTVQATALRPTLDLVGTLVSVPERTVVLSSQIAGFVSRVAAQEGQTVHAGDPIVLLDSRLVEADVNKAAAAVDQARSNLSLLEKGPLPAEVEAVRQDAQTAAAAAQAKREKFKALEPLHDRGEIADVQFQIAQSGVAESDAASRAAAEHLKVLQGGTRKELIEQAQAQLKSTESDLAAQKLCLALCTVTSPIDGVVTQLPVRQGMSVDKPTTLATVMDLSFLFARVHLPTAYLAQVREGAAASVALNTGTTKACQGSVARIGKEADERSGEVDAMVRVENADGTLTPGLGCRVSLSLPEIADAVVVPTAAVADHNGEAVVTVIRDDKAYQTVVKTGVRTPDGVQILDGVKPGEVVATEGGYALPDGCPVHVGDESKPATQ
jgi:multidrug efflux pump subunit AcrA (membrane-fusion protein)